ncbi:hypothetical protein FGW20_05620 [Methanoculleus sp. FWC-SCC3]|uniref:DUF5666 domain-containing protein n=1 Tax=Methanoculleus methanifontis TaxID=2584086 RepID=A0ABT8M2F0_9EURY|nr:hypothetical protein [Methanoculleus sp. FWC-SCC3]MDN7012526.1 hypothetical protein [Methanoculleus sp. FWC-SCC3]
MQSLSKCCLLLLILGLCVPPAAAQAGSHTTLQVYTDETVLGRIVSITPASDVGAYSITITRGTSVQPAGVGDTLRHKDIITLQRGSFADIQLVDRSDTTMLGGGTGGTAVLIERAGGGSGQAATPEVTETPSGSGIIYVDYGQTEAGTVTSIQGRAEILRNARIFPVYRGDSLLVGDTLFIREGVVTVEIWDSGTRTIYEGGILSVEQRAKPQELLEPVFTFFNDLSSSLARALGFEVNTPTGGGARG